MTPFEEKTWLREQYRRRDEYKAIMAALTATGDAGTLATVKTKLEYADVCLKYARVFGGAENVRKAELAIAAAQIAVTGLEVGRQARTFALKHYTKYHNKEDAR